MDRRSLLKWAGSLAIFSPLAALGRNRTGVEPLEVVMPPRTHYRVDRLFRRYYDGDAVLLEEYRRGFAMEAASFALEDFSKITNTEGTTKIAVIYGRKAKVYDELQGHVLTPPYYIWCRCTIDIPLKAIKDEALLARLTRDEQGLLPHTYI